MAARIINQRTFKISETQRGILLSDNILKWMKVSRGNQVILCLDTPDTMLVTQAVGEAEVLFLDLRAPKQEK
jgi:hypothetical protein